MKTTVQVDNKCKVEGSVRVYTEEFWDRLGSERRDIFRKHNILLVGRTGVRYLSHVKGWEADQIGVYVDVDQKLQVNGTII